jgi:hypothetical protein
LLLEAIVVDLGDHRREQRDQVVRDHPAVCQTRLASRVPTAR